MDISNRQVIEWTLSMLELKPSHRISEASYGSGQTVRRTAVHGQHGLVSGVVSLPTMYGLARKRNARLISTGTMELYLGKMEALVSNPCIMDL